MTDKIKFTAIFMSIIFLTAWCCYAEEKKAQGLDMVTDTASAIVNKSLALVSGDLKVETTLDTDRVKNKANYTRNAIGQMVPRSSAVNRE
ncbi:MAG: hypothetical protein WCY36_07815 [Candidatus Omnitrophota bacterium]